MTTELENIVDALASILHLGLVAIRNHARGNPEYAFAEADHLHNLPNCIKGLSADLIRYYYDVERPCYLAAVTRLPGDMGHIARTFYHEPWQVIERYLKTVANQAAQATAPKVAEPGR
jgi:hypothetical protein